LAVDGPQSLTIDIPTLGYVVHFEATSVYGVDWATRVRRHRAVDTRNHPTQGGLYPVDDQRPQHIDRGIIEVAQEWTACWSAEGESGILADRLAPHGGRFRRKRLFPVAISRSRRTPIDR